MKYVKFLGSRLGCKLNDIKHFEHLLPSDSKVIVEGYAGSFALIRRNYYDNKDVKLHINDNDKDLIKILKVIQTDDNINKYIDAYNKAVISGNKQNKVVEEKVKALKVPQDIKDYLMSSYKVRGFYKLIPTSMNIVALQTLLNKCEITNDDITVVLNRYQNDPDAFLFLDPPYLDSDNTTYKGQVRKDENNKLFDNTEHYIKLMKYIKDPKTKCKVMIILNENAIINYLYDGFIKGTYTKTYQLSKNKTSHVIITNY